MKCVGVLSLFCITLALLVHTAFAAPAYQGGTGSTEWVSQGINGTPASDKSYQPQVSTDGQSVVFSSLASNLVVSDTNGQPDIFLYQRATDTITRVNLREDGSQSVGVPAAPYISADGRYIAFTSSDNDLTANDGNPGTDGFVRDVISGTTTLVTIATDGTPGNGDIVVTDLSANGRYVVFESNTGSLIPNDKNNLRDVFVHDRETQETTRVSVASDGTEGNDGSWGGQISADGSRVVFLSDATNLGTGDQPGRTLVVHERTTGQTRYLPLGMQGEVPNGTVNAFSMAEEGRYLAFASEASNLVEGDTNALMDVFRYDIEEARTERVSLRANGMQIYEESGAPALSADGRYALFVTTYPVTEDDNTSDQLDLFRKDMATGQVLYLMPEVSLDYGYLDIFTVGQLNGDGTVAVFTTFRSFDPNDPDGTQDIYLRGEIAPPPPTPTRTPAPNSLYMPAAIARTGIATYPRIANITAYANGNSFAPVADTNGDVVAFLSDATNLVAGDSNNVTDAFVWQADSNTITRVSVASDGTQANQGSTHLKLSENGRYVLFITEASTLAVGDTNGLADVYWHDRQTGMTEWVSVGLNGAAGDGVVTGADLSADGRWVLFSSQARNMTDTPLPAECPEADCETLYRRDMTTGVTETLLKDEQGIALAPLRAPSMSGDGQTVAFEHIKKIGETQVCGSYGIPVYGPYLYRVALTNETPVFTLIAASYHDELGAATNRCMMAYVIENLYTEPKVARYGEDILYLFNNYSATQYNSYRRDGATLYENGTHNDIYSIGYGSTFQEPSSAFETPPDGKTTTISGDGHVGVFAAGDLRTYYGQTATPEFPEDTNGLTDIYLFNRDTNHYQRITDAATGELSNGGSRTPALSANGRVVLFASEATNLVASDTNGVMDIYLWQWAR